MNKLIGYTIPVIIISVFFVACTLPDDEPILTPCEERLEYLQDLKLVIEELAAASVCSEEFECRYIAFGTKACGGPWSYLIYSSSIDTEELEALVADYNERENTYNIDCGATSDCSVPIPPVGFTCVDNQCIPVF